MKKNSLWLIAIPILLILLFLTRGEKVNYSHYVRLTSQRKVETDLKNITPFQLQNSFEKIAKMVIPAVVNINTLQIQRIEVPYFEFYFNDPFEEFFGDFFGGRRPLPRRQKQLFKRRLKGVGSGVLIDEKGYVLTNYHVVKGAQQINVTLSEKGKEKSYPAKIIGEDPRTDLAVIKIKSTRKFNYIKLGDSDKIEIGDWVLAIGSPFGLEHTVTAGIISAKRQVLSIDGRVYKGMIQTDAAINVGNSGGPLVNIKGEVIGINTAIYAPTGVFNGIGFAIPINKAKSILGQLIKKGKVTRGWLGVEIREVDKVIANQFGLKEEKGALINRVVSDSPADKAGLKRGDVIVKFNGKEVDDVLSLQEMVGNTPPKTKVNVKVIRDGKFKVLYVTIGTLQEEVSVKEKKQEKIWGLTVKNVNSVLSDRYNIPEGQQGVVVTDIERASKAEEIGLRIGDLIKSINRIPTPNMIEFNKAVSKVDLSKGIMLDVYRQGQYIYITYAE